MIIIGITGKKGCGKSTAAETINSYGPGKLEFCRLSFAAPLKDMLETLLNAFNITDMYGLDKEAPVPGIGCTLRHLYQSLGTEWGLKLIRPDLWVNAMATTIETYYPETARIVIDDVRFENEADYIRGKGGVIVHIERPGLVSNDPHVSETGIAFREGDIKLVNSNLEDFLRQFQLLAENLVSNYAK
jgi:hypothetical protein